MAYDLSTYAGRQQARDDAATAGKSVVVDAGGIYDRNSGRTSSGNTAFSGGSGSPGTGGPAAPAPVVPQTAPLGNPGNTQDILNAFKASSGFSLQELAEKKRQFDASLEWQKQMWANQGMPELQIKQQAQALAQREFEAQNALAQQNFQLAQELGRGNLGVSQRQVSLAEELGRGNLGVAQGSLGLDYLKTAASMGGPADVFQQDDFVRGAASSGAPAFLRALQSNTGLAAFGAPSGAAPVALTAPGIMGRMTTGGVPADHAAALNAIGGIAQAGGAALAPQAIESLNPDELAAMGSGFKKLGYSMPAFLNTYRQSRIAQGAAQAA